MSEATTSAQQTNFQLHLYQCWNTSCTVSYYSLTGHGKHNYFGLL